MNVSERDQAMTDERLDSLERWREEVEKRHAESFPSGDHNGHRRYHELQIELLAERRRLRQAILEKTIGALVLSALGGLLLACWHFLIMKIKGG